MKFNGLKSVSMETSSSDKKIAKKIKRKISTSHENSADEVNKKIKIEKPEVNNENISDSIQENIGNDINENIDNDKYNSNDNNSEDDNEETEQFSQKETNQLTGKFFRKSLNAEGGVDIVRKFVAICHENKSRDLVGEYLEAGGSALEVLRLLDTSEKKNLNNAAAVFSAIHLIIMKIMEKYPQHQSSADQACRYVLNSHLSLIHSMMSSQSITKQRKIILRLLTSMVTLGGNLPRELINHLSLHQQSVEFLAQQTKPTDPESVRKCFIHFILAFLVDGNALTIKGLLEKRGLLSSIFSGLVYDSHTTVHLVLTTVKNYVLENSAIMKTMKLHVFSTPVVQSLVNLYNWSGPKNWSASYKKRVSVNEHVDPAEKKVAIEAVHNFLTILLTNNRYGIIFTDKSLGTSGRKHNQLVNTVLAKLDRPWEHEQPCNLVVKILSSCPDLVKPQLIYTEAYLVPRLSSKWISVMKFVYKIIESIDINNHLKPNIVELNLSQLINASLTLTMPSIVLKTAIHPCVEDKSIILRHQAIIMLILMCKQIKKFLNIAKNHLNESDYNKYKSSVVNYMKKNMPSTTDILAMWNKATEVEESAEEISVNIDMSIQNCLPAKIDHFSSIIELLENYRDVSAELFSVNLLEISEKQSDIKLLTNFEDTQADEKKLNEVKIKTIEINYQLNPVAFDPKEKLFKNSFTFLLSCINITNSPTNRTIRNTSPELDRQAKHTLKVLLKSLRIFYICDDQIDVWVHCFSYLSNIEQRSAVTKWFVKIIKRATKSHNKYSEAPQMDTNSNNNQDANVNKSSAIPNVLLIALDNLKNHPDEHASIYMSYVIVLTLHYQTNPSALINSMADIPGLSDIYLSSWGKGSPVSLKKYFPDNIISNYSKVLLSKEIIKFDKLFSGEKMVDFHYEGQQIIFNHSLTLYEALNIFQMTLFYLTQLLRCKQLHQELLDRIKLTLIAFLHIGVSLNEETDLNVVEKFASMIFSNPIILKYFSVVLNDHSYEIFTSTVSEICKITTSIIGNLKNIMEIIFLFKNKLLFELILLISTQNKQKKQLSLCAVELVETFLLTKAEVLNLLKKIVNLPEDLFIGEKHNLSSWGMILPKLIDLLLTNEPSENEREKLDNKRIIQKMLNILINIKSKKKIKLIETWEICLMKYLKKMPECISIIDNKKLKGLLEHNLTVSITNLAGFIISKNKKLIPKLIEFIQESNELQHKNMILPIIGSNLSYKWDQPFLSNIFNQYRREMLNYFVFTPSENENTNWISNNIDAVSYLIRTCFTDEICNEISRKILSSGDKLEAVDINYTKLLYVLYEKRVEFNNSQDIMKEFIQILIRILVCSLKKNTKDKEKIGLLCTYLFSAIDHLKNSSDNFVFVEVQKNHSWPQFVRFSLKFGLKKSPKNNQSAEGGYLPEEKSLPLLKVVAKMVDVAYHDNSNDEYVKTIFQMSTSHSEFINTMLNNDNDVKSNLLMLLWVLIRKNNDLMSVKQIPLFLSSYNATLNESDQLILLILQHYESSGIKLTDFRPYLWGEAAANHYSIKSDIDTSLLRQPSTSQVLELFNEDMINDTVTNFPVHRNLKSIELHETSNVYDPAFFLPLLVDLLGVNNVVSCHNVVRSGALALIFAGCGSIHEDIRLAAFTVLSRFYFHLEATRNKNKLLWIRFIDALRNGVANERSEVESTSEMNSLKKIQLNRFITTFLAKASLISARPINPLFVPIQLFLMAKPALDLQGIPEFLTLFNSSDINHKIYRHWILEVIRDGMRTDVEGKLALRYSVFRMICDFYHCILADSDTKNRILQVLKSTTKIVKTTMILIRDYSLLIWLNEAARNLKKHDVASVELVLDIISNLLDIFRVLKLKDDDRDHYKFLILVSLNHLKEHIPKKNVDENNLVFKYSHCINLIR